MIRLAAARRGGGATGGGAGCAHAAAATNKARENRMVAIIWPLTCGVGGGATWEPFLLPCGRARKRVDALRRLWRYDSAWYWRRPAWLGRTDHSSPLSWEAATANSPPEWRWIDRATSMSRGKPVPR